MTVSECRHFSGYKPCQKNEVCSPSCLAKDLPHVSILVVHLGALGAVVRSTSLLRAIKRKFPSSMITWVTDAPAHHLLKGHPVIDRVLTANTESDLLQLAALQFEVAFVIDKSLKAVGIISRTSVDQVFGFKANPRNGAILPATPAAEELWHLGIDNQKKFFENEKAETQLMIEALELGPFQRDEYWLPLTAQEEKESFQRRQQWLKMRNMSFLIGLNTGCSNVIPYKKLSVPYHREMILKIQQAFPQAEIVLLGGPEDTERNNEISKGFSLISSETEKGLRDGLVSIAACDVVITGDSLGMHMAISQKKSVIAWFGPTCAQEIDLYERGVKIATQSPCSPCWKRTCEKNIMCYDQVSLEEIIHALESCCANSLFGRLAALHPTP
ncbi:MAG: glycosyltransferase family 9 protein [Pseudobdellovibrionaceae bacterium]